MAETSVSKSCLSGENFAAQAVFWGLLGGSTTIASIFMAAEWKDDLQIRLHADDTLVYWLDYILDVFTMLAFPAGFAVDTFGPAVVMCLSATMNALGYGSLVLVVMDWLPWPMSFLSMILIGQGGIWLVMAVLSVFGQLLDPADRGSSVGVAMTWFSLAPIVMNTIIHAILKQDEITTVFYVVCGAIMSAAALLCALVLLVAPWRGSRQQTAASLGLEFAVAISIIASVTPLISVVSDFVSVFLPISFVVSLAFMVASRFCTWNIATETREQVTEVNPHFVRGATHDEVEEQADVSLGGALRESRFWVLFLVLGSLCGSGMTVSNHLSALVLAIGWSTTSAVAFFAVGNSLARILLGYFSGKLIKIINRSSFLVIFTWLMCFGLLLIVALPNSVMAVKIGITLCGFGFGSPWMLVPAIEMEWYGNVHFGRIHGFMMLSGTVGMTLFRIEEEVYKGTNTVLTGAVMIVAFAAFVATLHFFVCPRNQSKDAYKDVDHLSSDLLGNSLKLPLCAV